MVRMHNAKKVVNLERKGKKEKDSHPCFTFTVICRLPSTDAIQYKLFLTSKQHFPGFFGLSFFISG